MASFSGTVSGSNTVDIKYYSDIYEDDKLTYKVKASGSGSNQFIFKVQQKKNGIGWKTLAKHKLDMPSDSASGTVTVDDLFDDWVANEIIRFRMSRKLGTKAVDYEVEFSVS